MVFNVVYRTRSGKKAFDAVTADTKDEALAVISARGDFPLSAKPYRQPIFGGRTLHARELITLTKIFSVIASSRIPFPAGLRIFASSASSNTARIASGVAASVEGGESITKAIERYPLIFDGLYTGMVRAGEAFASLADVFSRLYLFLERRWTVSRKLRQAATYPAILFATSIIVVAFILGFVVPNFRDIVSAFGKAMPPATAFVFAVSDIFRATWVFILAAIVIVTSAIVIAWPLPTGKAIRAKLMLAVPIIRPWRIRILSERYVTMCAMLLGAKAQFVDAIAYAARAMDDAEAEAALICMHDDIRGGKSIAESMKGITFLDPRIAEMTRLGEETGTLRDIYASLAAVYERELDDMTAEITAVLQPVLIIFIGIVVAAIILALFLPLFGIAGSMGAQ